MSLSRRVALPKRSACVNSSGPLVISRNYLWQFLQAQASADNIVALYGELELQQTLNQSFDRAVYYGVLGYVSETGERECAQMGLSRIRQGSTGWPHRVAL